MIFEGKFKSIDDQYIYYVKVGNTGITREIQDGDIDAYNDGKILCFSGKSPVTIEYDMSDTFENVYIRSCTVNLISNYDIRQYVVADNYMDIPIIVKQAEVGYNDTEPVSDWLMVFDGYVNPLSFNQPFAKEWNQFSLECTDRLGVLEYKKFPELLQNMDYNTPRYFMSLALGICGFSSINYNIAYYDPSTLQLICPDNTLDTKINPAIFVGDSEDDWMTCLEVIQEIGKIYGCFYWQDGSVCNVQNILLHDTDLTNAYQVRKEDYMDDDANISVDEAYNVIKCEVDISDIDDDFLDPFKKENITPTTKWPERIITEIGVGGEDSPSLSRFRYILGMTPSVRNWSGYYGNIFEYTQIWDNYAQILENPLFEFSLYDALGHLSRPSYLDSTSDGGGGGRSTTNAINTLNWLKQTCATRTVGAFIGYGSTENLVELKNTSSITLDSLKKALVIQIGGHCSDDETESRRIESLIQAGNPICTFKLESSNNLTPNDVSTTNYLLINGKILLNPCQPKTGLNWGNSNWYLESQNTVQECLNAWPQGNFAYTSTNTFKGRTFDVNGKNNYYQNYTWTNVAETEQWPYPWNQTPVLNMKNMFYPPLNAMIQKFKWQGSYYNEDEPSEIDDIAYVPLIACELKIGDKYLCEDMSKIKQYNWQILTPSRLQEIYQWKTQAEATAAGLGTHFTLGIDPSIGDYILGKENDIKKTSNISFGIQKNGFAIPIPYTAALNGEVTFKILGPVNASWDDVGYDSSGWWFWKSWWTTHNRKTILSYVENIVITNFEFSLVSDNQRKEQLNDDNDLVYYSANTDRYTDDKDFSCKFCTSLTTQEVNDLGVDYNLNNSSILGTDNLPWYGMTYHNVNGVKLEEARVSEQYEIWKKPRNILEVTLKLDNPEKCNYQQNFTFSYLDGIYKVTEREIDLKLNTMKCTMKDFS